MASRAVERAGRQQADYVNRRRTPVTYQPEDLVLLSSRNLPLRGSKKLLPRWMGPFRVLKTVGPVACKLELPPRWQHVHPVFHVSLLRQWTGRMPEHPPPLLLDGEEEYEIERIVGHQDTRRGRRYVVRWRGYSEEEDSALYLEDLGNAQHLLEEYHRGHGIED